MNDMTREEIERLLKMPCGEINERRIHPLCRQLLAHMATIEHAKTIVREMTRVDCISLATSERLLECLTTKDTPR